MAMLNNQRVYTAKIGVRTNSFIAISYKYIYIYMYTMIYPVIPHFPNEQSQVAVLLLANGPLKSSWPPKISSGDSTVIFQGDMLASWWFNVDIMMI